MRKRDILILFCMMACFTSAVMLTIIYQEQARKRAIDNYSVLCTQLERLTHMPCQLEKPPAGLRDGAKGG